MFFPTLFNVRINWVVYIIIMVGVVIIIPDISIWRFFAMAITVHQALLVFYSFGYVIPVRYLAGAFACLQYLVGSTFAYSGLDDQMFFKYRMQVPEDVYFSYAIPAVILFILGLHISGRLNGEKIDERFAEDFADKNRQLPYIFIVVGFLSSVISGFFGAELANVFYILSGFKFVGLFMLLLSREKLKILPLVIVVGAIVSSSLKSAMFHDLLTWLIFVMAVLAIRYKPTVITKGIIGFGFLILIITIQQLKGIYRQNISGGGGSLEEFQETFVTVNQSNNIFDLSNIAGSNSRINQGFIVTYAMSYIPAKEPFAQGEELYKILEAAFMPRIIAPNKLKAGDNEFVYKYTGMRIRQGTSMSISALGDAYVNFGVFGGCIFMFLFGCAFNMVLNGFQRFSRHFPILLLFTPLVFYYPIRPDTALQTGLGHMVKASFLLWMMIIFWKKDFARSDSRQPNSQQSEGKWYVVGGK